MKPNTDVFTFLYRKTCRATCGDISPTPIMAKLRRVVWLTFERILPTNVRCELGWIAERAYIQSSQIQYMYVMDMYL